MRDYKVPGMAWMKGGFSSLPSGQLGQTGNPPYRLAA